MKPPITLAAFQEQVGIVEKQLRLELEGVRASLRHGGNKGASVEASFRSALGRYLPRRLSLAHGEVIDTYGTRSGQCDVVIVTDQHPNWYTSEEPALFLVEAVAAAAEVKAVLTSAELASAVDIAKQFRALRPSWGGHAEVVGAEEDIQRYYRNPPFFLFAYESQLSIDTIAERIVAAHEPGAGRHGEPIDAVFLLDRGYILNFGYGRSAFAAQDDEGNRLVGYYHDDKDPLLTLLMWLPTALAIPLSQLPVLSQYLLGESSARSAAELP